MASSPIRLISRKIFNLDSATPTDWLLANVGDLIRIETVFSVQNEVIGSEEEPFIINNKSGYLEDGWLTDSTYRFKNFKVGDEVYFYNYANNIPVDTGNFTVVEKLSDGEIRIDPAPTSPANTSAAEGVISVKTPITSIKYSYGFIENSNADSFASPIDGNEQIFAIDTKLASDTTVSPMKGLGPVTWRDSNPNVTIQGVSIVTTPVYKSTYKIIHYTQVTPYILYEQLENQLAGLPHKDFELTKCWKLITRIEAAEVYTNPNFLVSEVFNKDLGNSGGYGENFNTGITKYKILNIKYTNLGKQIDAIQFDDSDTVIEFEIDNQEATFTNGQIIRLGFFKVPSDPSEYQNNNQFANINFLFDGARVVVGSPEVSGYGYSPDAGIGSIYKASAKVLLPTKILVSIRIRLAATTRDVFEISSTPRYFIFAALKNQIYGTLDPLNDQVALPVAFSEFTYVTDDPGMIVVDKNVFLQHPDNDPLTEGIDTTSYLPPYADSQASVMTGLTNNTVLMYLNRPVGDPLYGTVLGASDWQGSVLATAQKLADSVNDKVAYGVLFPPFTSLFNPEGFTASATNAGGGNVIFTILSPLNSHDKYNGKTVAIKQNGIGTDINTVFSGGIKGTKKTIDVFVEDEIVACTNFFIERDTRPFDEILITSIESKLVATNGADSFDLESFKVQTGAVSLTGDTQQIDTSILRQFHIPNSEPRKVVVVKRRNDLDVGSKKYFSVQYPFMFRWEYWEKILNANSFFLDTTKPNNNLNHHWLHYNSGSWKINYQLVINATKNGEKQRYEFTEIIKPHDYVSNPYYIVKKIETFDADTLTPLLIAGKDYVSLTNKTLVVATFEIGFGVTIDQATVEIGMEVYEKGGILGKRSYSSRWNRDGDTWFESINGDGLVDLTLTGGNLIVAKCLINNDSLSANAKSFSIMARCYEFGPVPHRYITDDTPDENPLTDNSGNNLIKE